MLQCCPLPLILSLGTTEEHLAPLSLCLPFRYFFTLRFPTETLFSKLNCPISLSLPPYVPVSVRGALNWTQHSSCGPPVLTEEENHFPQSVINALPMADKDPSHLPCSKDTLGADVRLGVHQDPASSFLSSLFPAEQPPAYTGTLDCSSPGAGLHISLLNFSRFLSSHFSSLMRPLCMAAPTSISPSFVSSSNLLRAQSSPSLTKILTRTGPSIDPWITQMVTGLQFHATDHHPLHPLSQFIMLLTVCSSNPYFISLSVRIL